MLGERTGPALGSRSSSFERGGRSRIRRPALCWARPEKRSGVHVWARSKTPSPFRRRLPAGSVQRGAAFAGWSCRFRLALLPPPGGVREALVESATQELVERLAGSGRFRVTMGDAINVFLRQEGIKTEEFLQGKGVKQAAERFQAQNLLAIYFKRVQTKPFMEVRFFSQPQADPVITTAFFVPSTIKPPH